VNAGSEPPMRGLGITQRPRQFLRMQALLFDLVGYGLVSVAALAVDAAILRALVTRVGFHYLPASVVSFVVGAAVAYVLSVRFVFRSRQADKGVLKFGYFVALGLVGVIVNAAVLAIAISGVGLGLITAKLCAALFTFATNFVLRRELLFSPTRDAE
jgi:putative flippase GtrA